ncbi:MAG TPA: PorV/PorQ family protein, partial [bacterium]|nr:PorV/PorQ family protein [bacterium]
MTKKNWWLAVLMVFPAFSQGQTFSSAGSALQFLDTQTGAKATALGGAYSAIADDPSAVYWNPAGLAWIPRVEIQTTYNQWFMDSYFQDLGIVFPTSWGALGSRLSYVNFGSFDLRDQSGNLLGSEVPTAWAGAFSVAIRMGSLGFGLSAEGDREIYGNYSISGLGLGAGALFRSDWASLSLGVRNIGQAEGYVLPLEFYAGGAATLGPPSLSFRFSTDATMSDGSLVLHHGLECGDQILFLRVGYQWLLQPQPNQDQAGLAGGVGVWLDDFQLDYSITSNGDLGLTNKVAISYAFGQAAPVKRPRHHRVKTLVKPTPTPYVVAIAPSIQPIKGPAQATPTPYVAAAAPPRQPAPQTPSAVPPAPTESMRVLYKRGIA